MRDLPNGEHIRRRSQSRLVLALHSAKSYKLGFYG